MNESHVIRSWVRAVSSMFLSKNSVKADAPPLPIMWSGELPFPGPQLPQL